LINQFGAKHSQKLFASLVVITAKFRAESAELVENEIMEIQNFGWRQEDLPTNLFVKSDMERAINRDVVMPLKIRKFGNDLSCLQFAAKVK